MHNIVTYRILNFHFLFNYFTSLALTMLPGVLLVGIQDPEAVRMDGGHYQGFRTEGSEGNCYLPHIHHPILREIWPENYTFVHLWTSLSENRSEVTLHQPEGRNSFRQTEFPQFHQDFTVHTSKRKLICILFVDSKFQHVSYYVEVKKHQ